MTISPSHFAQLGTNTKVIARLHFKISSRLEIEPNTIIEITILFSSSFIAQIVSANILLKKVDKESTAYILLENKTTQKKERRELRCRQKH